MTFCNSLINGQTTGNEKNLIDRPVIIKMSHFDSIINKSISLLSTKDLAQISDSDHVSIIKVINTIGFQNNNALKQKFSSGIYDKFLKLIDQKDYRKNIIKVYPDWVPNRGMGFYFKKLNIELDGTPHYFSKFELKE